MGADLIVCILVGPDKFAPAKVKKAKAQAAKFVAAAKRIKKGLWNEKKEDSPQFAKDTLLFNDMLAYEQYGSVQEAEGVIESIANIKPAQFVNEFIQWWRSCSGRDTTGRSLPRGFKKDWKIVVCGETSGGQSPDGEGWNNVRTAEWLGIIDILGIK